MELKRYQRWTREGLVWSKWFPWKGGEAEKWQLHNKQLNEYKTVTTAEWKEIEKKQEELA